MEPDGQSNDTKKIDDLTQEREKVQQTEEDKLENTENYETIADLVELVEGLGTENISRLARTSRDIITNGNYSKEEAKQRSVSLSKALAKEITIRALNMIDAQNGNKSAVAKMLAESEEGNDIDSILQIVRQSTVDSLGLQKHTQIRDEYHEDRHGTPITRKIETSYYDIPKEIEDSSIQLSYLVEMMLNTYGLTRANQKLCESIISGKIRAHLSQ